MLICKLLRSPGIDSASLYSLKAIISFFADYFLKVHFILHRQKVLNKSQNSRNQVFFYYFSLMMGGSGSVPRTNGSDLGGPKLRDPENCYVTWRNRFLGPLNVYKFELGARIVKLFRSPRIDSMKLISPVCVAWRAGTTTLFLLGSYSPHRLFKKSSTGNISWQNRLIGIVSWSP
jgi:hypothetical protein